MTLSSSKLSSFLFYTIIFFTNNLLNYSHGSSTNNGAAGSGGGIYGGRHSYSLTTFDPSGNLDQVVRAMRASMLGVPIVALVVPSKESSMSRDLNENGAQSSHKIDSVVTTQRQIIINTNETPASSKPIPDDGGIYFCVPLRFLTISPLMVDDGTPRFVPVTSSICISHTGVGADGRSLCDFAVKLALDYKYLYGEEISAEELLEGVAEKVQEMTMKGGARPFGCALLVGCLGSDFGSRSPAIYRVDPSGAVELMVSCNNNREDPEYISKGSNFNGEDATTSEKLNDGRKGLSAFLGNWGPVGRRIDALRNELENKLISIEEEILNMLAELARESFSSAQTISEDNSKETKQINKPVLFASFTRKNGLQLTRIID